MTSLTCIYRFSRWFGAVCSVAAWGCTADGGGEELDARQLGLAGGEVTTLVQGIGDAENATFSSDGRLFVTGGENAYEIVRDGAGYRALPLYAGTCNFTGIAERAGYLYAACAEGPDLLHSVPRLLAAPLGPAVRLEVIYDFERVRLPNGIAFDERGRLFVVDFTPLLGQLVTLQLDPRQPTKVLREEVWHAAGHLLANGIKIHRGAVFMTDLTNLKRIPIRADGSAGRVRVLATRLTVFDDLYVDDTGIFAADFLGGSIVTYSLAGQFLQETGALFESPSSIIPSRAPLFAEGSWIVTEKGTLGELTSDVGNRVSLLRP
jgi:hypothetical protein